MNIVRKLEGLVLVSKFPPPLGGVTVYAERKLDYLRKQGTAVYVVDLRSKVWLAKAAFAAAHHRDRRFIINTLHPVVLTTLWLAGVLSRCTLYDHNLSSAKHRLTLRIYRFFASRAERIIIVSPHLRALYDTLGLGGKVAVESPYLRPELTRLNEIMSRYPVDVRKFLNMDNRVKLVNSACWFAHGQTSGDLYGIGTSVRLLESLNARGVDAHLLLAFGRFNKRDMPSMLLAKIRSGIAAGTITVMSGQRELWPVFRTADIFLRLTETDGESVSVLEALDLGCKVVASDVVPRPTGAMRYAYGDDRDLFRTILSLVDQRSNVLEAP